MVTRAGGGAHVSRAHDAAGADNADGADELPSLSVVIPTAGRHRIALLEGCLRALARNAGIDAVEVIVVLDGGDPQDYAHLTDTLPHVRLVPRPQGGPGAARNTGWQSARGDVIAFVDDDTEPQPDWLADLYHALHRHPDTAGMGGRILPMQPRNHVSAVLTVYGHIDHRITRHGALLITGNATFRRHALEAVGGFWPSLALAGEDFDLCQRLHAAGFRTVRLDDATVMHHHPTTVDALLATCRRYREGTPESIATYSKRAPRRVVGRLGRNVARVLYAMAHRLPASAATRTWAERVAVAPLFVLHVPAWFVQARRAGTGDGTGTGWFTYRTGVRDALTMALLEWLWMAEWERITHEMRSLGTAPPRAPEDRTAA